MAQFDCPVSNPEERTARNPGGSTMRSSFRDQAANSSNRAMAYAAGQANLLARLQDKRPADGRWKHTISGEQVDLETGCEVISDQSPGRNVWLVRSGILRLQRFAFDGRRQILSLSLPGEIVGYDRQWREGMSLETATRCCLCRIDRREFDFQMANNPLLRQDFYKQQHDQIEHLRWLTWSIGALRPEERLSAFLALATRFMPYRPLSDGTSVLSMMLARLDIADLLATTVESISRITHSLNEAGVIDILDSSHFRIVDLKKLTQFGRIDATFDSMPFRARSVSDDRFVKTIACTNCEFETAC
jgi:CRP-like cAMP-binding protein